MDSSNAWRNHAACRGMDLNMFFDAYEAEIEVQLKVDDTCRSCHVQRQCLEWAIENKVEFGVWGRKYFDSTVKKKRKRKANA